MSAQSAGTAARRARKPSPAAAKGKLSARDEQVLKHLPLVRAIAARVRESLPVQVELDDLAHAGVLGLFDAVAKYDASKKVAFHLYAKHRIRGAILDSLRQLDWASRDLRKRYKSIEAAGQRQAQKFGRAPAEEEVAEALGLTPAQLRKQKSDLQSAGLTSGQPHRVEQPDNSYAEPSESPDHSPDHIFANHQLRSALDVAVETLPPRYQTVIRLYYDKECTMKQIGAELGVNESRVSQIHKTALQKLAAALRANGYADHNVFLEEPARTLALR